MTTTPSPREVLALSMEDNDSGADTIGGYLVALLAALWEEGEDFGGKRPFGNSGWQFDLYGVLVKAEIITGAIDEHGCPYDADHRAGDAVIAAAIAALGQPEPTTADTDENPVEQVPRTGPSLVFADSERVAYLDRIDPTTLAEAGRRDFRVMRALLTESLDNVDTALGQLAGKDTP
jgi:hypothetical protein